MEKEWVMPPVELGQTVSWNWNAAGRTPSPAIVIGVGQTTLNLAIHVTGVKDHVLRTGVRHREDPFLKQNPQHEAGVWELTDRDRKLDLLLREYDTRVGQVARNPKSS